MSSRFDQSKTSRLSRNEFVELGETLLTIANRQFGTPCKTAVTCFTTNYRLTDCDMDWPHQTSPEQLQRENDANTRLKLTRIQDLLPEDFLMKGRIEISIEPVDKKAGPATAWAVISTAGKKDSVSAHIQGGDMPTDILKPLAAVWDEQNPVATAPRRFRDFIKQALA